MGKNDLQDNDSSIPEDLLEQANTHARDLIQQANEQALTLIEKANTEANFLIEKADLQASVLIEKAYENENNLINKAIIGENQLLAFANELEKELIQQAKMLVNELLNRASSLEKSLSEKAEVMAMDLTTEASLKGNATGNESQVNAEALLLKAGMQAKKLVSEADEHAKLIVDDADKQAKVLVNNAGDHAKELKIVADESAKILVKEAALQARFLVKEAAIQAKDLVSEAALKNKVLISEASFQSKNLIREAAVNYIKSKLTFLNIAAHELRTPITSISLRIQFAEREIEKGRSITGLFISQIRGPLNRLLRLLSYILDLSMLERGVMVVNPVKADLISLISDTLEEFRLENPNFQFNFKAPDKKIETSFDPLRIHQVLSNFLDNSVKHSGSESIDVFLRINQEMVRVEITDSGVGISKENQKQLFTSFHKGDPVGQSQTGGLGLGLLISKEIMKLHNGKIGYNDSAKGGSKFFFELPLGNGL